MSRRYSHSPAKCGLKQNHPWKLFLSEKEASICHRYRLYVRLYLSRFAFPSLSQDDFAAVRIRRGWYFGAEGFRQELLEAMSSRIGPEHYGPEQGETQEQKAESIIATELRKRRLSQARPASLAKGNSAKLDIASRLQSETTMSVAWIVQRLNMGARNYAYRLLYLHRRQRSGGDV